MFVCYEKMRVLTTQNALYSVSFSTRSGPRFTKIRRSYEFVRPIVYSPLTPNRIG